MEQSHIWLSTSLFCHKEHWNDVLQNGIQPFLLKHLPPEQSNIYEIAFNHNSGSDIRLSLLALVSDAKNMAEITDQYFKTFFSQKDYPGRSDELSDTPHPSISLNTLQQETYAHDGHLFEKDKRLQAFRKTLSDLIIQVLAKNVIDEEEILLFAFYLNLFYIRALATHHYKIDLSGLYRQYLDKTDLSITEEMAIDAYEANKDILADMASEIASFKKSAPAALQQWASLCEEDIAIALKEGDELMYTNYLRIFNLVNKQLAVTENTAVLLICFIRQVAWMVYD